MSKKKFIKNRKDKLKINANISLTKEDNQKKTPVFSFEYLQNNLKKIKNENKINLIEQLHRLSQLTWQDIGSSQRHGLGFETMEQKSITGTFPNNFTQDEKVIIFRYNGKLPMIGIRRERIYYIVFVANDYSEYYSHS